MFDEREQSMTTETTGTEIVARVDLQKRTAPARRLEVRAELYRLGSNPRPHFSVTCTEYERGRDVGGGADHELILQHFPELAPVVRVHLADDLGRPMYAEANALYWGGFSTWPGPEWRQMVPDDDYGRRTLETDGDDGLVWAPQTFADHLRVSLDEGRKLRAYVAEDPTSHYSAAMHFICQSLAAQWQAEADEALTTIRRLAGEKRDDA
jgi:hypothetical protein